MTGEPRLIDHIKDLYADTVYHLDVPEWGVDGKPCRVFYRPYTIADERKIAPALREGSPDAWLSIVIDKATDEHGERLFTLEDKPILARVGMAPVVKRLGIAMSMCVGQDDAAGN